MKINSTSTKSLIDYKSMFKTYRDAIDVIMRYKTKIVAKDYSQVVGFNFNETYSFLAKFTTTRTFLAIWDSN